MDCYSFKPKDFDFNSYGAFFAFSQKQFHDRAQKGIKYVNCGAGLIAPADIVEKMLDDIDEHYNKENQRILDEKGLDSCILYELLNHECYYTYNLTPAIEACKDRWNASAECVKRVFKENKHKYQE